MEKSSFKDAMARIPTSVFIVGVKVEELVTACTISSVVSVDIERQIISFVLQKSSSTLKAIRSKKTFGISLLNDQQSAVSKHFSSLEKSFSDEKFVWDLQNENFPIIPKSIGNFHCNLVETYELESTYIVLGKVEKFHTVTSGNPLVYWNRKHLSLKLK
jgi:flavin reductase (DIM6/NTAB) family NADH-FMN oxidoreductase RutF